MNVAQSAVAPVADASLVVPREGRRRVPAEAGAVEVVHAVPGRVRLKIEELRGSRALKTQLERGLRRAPGVVRATASELTGSLLVRYDETLVPAQVVRRARDVLAGRVDGDRDRTDGGVLWHALDATTVERELGSSSAMGLGPDEAGRRLAQVGRNALPVAAGRSNLSIVAGQFASLPVALLAGAAGVCLISGTILEAVAIATVVGLNAVIGFVTESRAERTIRSLGVAEPGAVEVVRGGGAQRVDAATLVPGDVLHLRRGMVVPADARLVAGDGLSVSEAALTGESLPVLKSEAWSPEATTALGDRRNMVYRGTTVTGGSATALVVATGGRTEVGRIQQLVETTGTPDTRIERQLDDFGRQLVVATLAASGLIFAVGWFRGLGAVQMLRSAISVAVAAVPEGLPMVATTSLAFGVGRMRRRRILMRRLDVVETLATVDTVCFDKTGTLTLNRMAVAELRCGDDVHPLDAGVDDAGARAAAADDPRVDCLLQIAALCNETETEAQPHGIAVRGSATEAALVHAAMAGGHDPIDLRRRCPQRRLQHRSDSCRFMASAHETPSGPMLMVKGSPGEVLGRCRWELGADGGRVLLTARRRAEISRTNDRMAERALRVLGFAYRDEAGATDTGGAADGLTWVGLAGLSDPVRRDARAVVRRLQRAGIRTVMLTGDQTATARAVAEEVGLRRNGAPDVVDAATLEGLGTGELREVARHADVFARVSPGQKLEIVQALQSTGATVAMMGDGINDSPALRAAHAGLAIGAEGAAAREVADVFIDSDDLGTVVAAIEQGRTTATNIRKSLRFLLGTNTSEVMLMLAGTAAGSGAVLTPMQLLWINLISDVLPGIGLALEPPDPRALAAGPQPADEPILSRAELAPLAFDATLVGSGAFAAALYGAARYGGAAPQTSTMTFGSLVLAQLLHAITCRSPETGIFNPGPRPANRPLSLILAGSLAAQSAAMVLPGVRRLLGVGPVGGLDAAVVLAGGTLPFVLAESRKLGRAAPATPADARFHLVKAGAVGRH